jgi:hypothetical protein
MPFREQLIHDAEQRRGKVIYLKPARVRVPWVVLLLSMAFGAAAGVALMTAVMR